MKLFHQKCKISIYNSNNNHNNYLKQDLNNIFPKTFFNNNTNNKIKTNNNDFKYFVSFLLQLCKNLINYIKISINI